MQKTLFFEFAYFNSPQQIFMNFERIMVMHIVKRKNNKIKTLKNSCERPFYTEHSKKVTFNSILGHAVTFAEIILTAQAYSWA